MSLTWLSLAGTCIPGGLVGAGLPAAEAHSSGDPRGSQSFTPEPRRPQAPAPGHPPAAEHPAPLGAGRPGLPGVQQHRALPLPRYEGGMFWGFFSSLLCGKKAFHVGFPHQRPVNASGCSKMFMKVAPSTMHILLSSSETTSK